MFSMFFVFLFSLFFFLRIFLMFFELFKTNHFVSFCLLFSHVFDFVCFVF